MKVSFSHTFIQSRLIRMGNTFRLVQVKWSIIEFSMLSLGRMFNNKDSRGEEENNWFIIFVSWKS